MAGSDARFDPTQFREAIQFAMNMGLPNSESQQITWQWTTERTFSTADSGGKPFVWASSEVESTETTTDLIVLCAVKFNPTTSQRVEGTGLGVIDMTTVQVTLLDEQWDELIEHGGRFPDKATIDGNIYYVRYVAPPVGLFEVTVYDVFLQAQDET